MVATEIKCLPWGVELGEKENKHDKTKQTMKSSGSPGRGYPRGLQNKHKLKGREIAHTLTLHPLTHQPAHDQK